MNILPGRVWLTSLAATVLFFAAVAAGSHRAAAQITGLAVDNTNSSGSVSNGTGQNICTTQVSTTVVPLGGNVGESRNQVTIPASSPTSFTTRFVADICTDSGGSTVSSFSCNPGSNAQSLVADYTTNFGVNAPSGTNYRVTVTNQAGGAVDIVNDGGNASQGTMSQIATSESGGSLFGGGSLNLTNGLPINQSTAGSYPFTNPAQTQTTVYLGTGSGAPNPHSIHSTFSATCNSPANGWECALRMGLPCTITGGAALVGDTTLTAGQYPGTPARNQATDGQFVSAQLEFCGDGIIQQDGVLTEQCDNGLDPVTGNGGTASCCNTNCTVKTSGMICRVAAGECDVPDACNGISPTCSADAKKAAGTPCTDDGNPCSADICDGATNNCTHPPGNPTAVCRASIDASCDPAELCTGTSTVCPADVHYPDGTLCPDDGNPCTADVCASGLCTHPAAHAGTVCRAATDTCDVAEVCDGSTTTCPADAVAPAGTACPDDGKLCTSDLCDGTSKACQHTGINTKGTICRPAVGPCDLDEECDGTSPDCPPDSFRLDQIDCRDAAGPCDVEEYCTGTSPICPPDGKEPAGYVCSPAIGGDLCDVDGVCDGINNTCPGDSPAPTGTLCRSATGVCDTDGLCDGTSKTCPPDQFVSSEVVCRDAQGVCDAVEYCTGTFADCPFDLKDPNFTECRPVTPPGNVCDVAEYCNGSDNDCPPDQFGPSSNVCRAAVSNCDINEFCTGTSATCPPDAVEPSSMVCRNAAGLCDLTENCTGTSAVCPPDLFSTALCRPADNSGCDVADYCTGTAPDCPPDAKQPDGTICSGTNANTCLNACVTGVCTDACPGCADLSAACGDGCPREGTVVVPNCCGNGILDTSTGEQCDDGNQLPNDACPISCNISGNGSLIRGDVYNPETRDIAGCQVEFFVQNPPLDLDRFGQPARIQVCNDQDPTCDLDPTPGRCLFHVAVCLANNDPNLPLCTPYGINSIKINTRPYLRKSSPQLQFVGANNAKFQHAMTSLFDTADPSAGFSNHAPLSPDQHDLCSGGFLVEVYAGSAGTVRQSLISAQEFRVRSQDQRSPSMTPLTPRRRTDNSSLILVCNARPLP